LFEIRAEFQNQEFLVHLKIFVDINIVDLAAGICSVI